MEPPAVGLPGANQPIAEGGSIRIREQLGDGGGARVPREMEEDALDLVRRTLALLQLFLQQRGLGARGCLDGTHVRGIHSRSFPHSRP
ncbi:hypothetical protein HK404_10445 [Myxococcus xanthus]|nr:hypothetical protein [Myxococcus xanthus]